jgi:hypothetical protein
MRCADREVVSRRCPPGGSFIAASDYRSACQKVRPYSSCACRRKYSKANGSSPSKAIPKSTSNAFGQGIVGLRTWDKALAPRARRKAAKRPVSRAAAR